MCSNMDGLIWLYIVIVVQLYALMVTTIYVFTCIRKKKDDLPDECDQNCAAIISYPEKPMFPVTSSTRIATSEVDVELNLDQPAPPEQPPLEVTNNAPAEKEIKNAFDPSGKPSEDVKVGAEKTSPTKATNVEKSERNWKRSPMSPLERTQSSKEININEGDDLAKKSKNIDEEGRSIKDDMTQPSVNIEENMNNDKIEAPMPSNTGSIR